MGKNFEGLPEAKIGRRTDYVEVIRGDEVEDTDPEGPTDEKCAGFDAFEGEWTGGEDHREDDEADFYDAHDEVDFD